MRLTTSPPSCAECHGIWEPKPPGALWATPGLLRDCFTVYMQGVSRLVNITAGGDFLGLCDQKSSYKHVSDFGRLRSYDRLKLKIEGNDY